MNEEEEKTTLPPPPPVFQQRLLGALLVQNYIRTAGMFLPALQCTLLTQHRPARYWAPVTLGDEFVLSAKWTPMHEHADTALRESFPRPPAPARGLPELALAAEVTNRLVYAGRVPHYALMMAWNRQREEGGGLLVLYEHAMTLPEYVALSTARAATTEFWYALLFQVMVGIIGLQWHAGVVHGGLTWQSVLITDGGGWHGGGGGGGRRARYRIGRRYYTVPAACHALIWNLERATPLDPSSSLRDLRTFVESTAARFGEGESGMSSTVHAMYRDVAVWAGGGGVMEALHYFFGERYGGGGGSDIVENYDVLGPFLLPTAVNQWTHARRPLQGQVTPMMMYGESPAATTAEMQRMLLDTVVADTGTANTALQSCDVRGSLATLTDERDAQAAAARAATMVSQSHKPLCMETVAAAVTEEAAAAAEPRIQVGDATDDPIAIEPCGGGEQVTRGELLSRLFTGDAASAADRVAFTTLCKQDASIINSPFAQLQLDRLTLLTLLTDARIRRLRVMDTGVVIPIK